MNAYARAGFLRDQVKFSLPDKPRGRVDWLTFEEVAALWRTAWGYREVQKGVVTRRWPTRHIAKFVAVGVATCSRSARIYEASYVAEKNRPWVDLVAGVFYRSAPDEKVAANKKAPPITISPRLQASMTRWATGKTLFDGKVRKADRYVCDYAHHHPDYQAGIRKAQTKKVKATPAAIAAE